MSKFRIIVTGLIAQYPLGGVVWDYIQYVLGLRRLGQDVYYFEDTQQWPYNPQEGGVAKDCSYNVEYLSNVMSHFGLDENWAYCFPWKSQWFGLTVGKRKEIIESADILINVSGVLAEPQKYRTVKKLVYIDSDPVFTQIKLARGQKDFKKLVNLHDIHFSFGESIAYSKDIPETGYDWLPTRQPIVLSEWRSQKANRDVFTTVMNWTSFNDVEFNGKIYGQKDTEFKNFADLPSRVSPAVLEIAINTGKTRRTPKDMLRHNGWRVVNPDVACHDFKSYKNYIQTSKAEFSVAKNGYVIGQSGWFSCRSGCYLAAGKPVVVQETGFSKILPTGKGIIPFSDMDEAVNGIQQVQAKYQEHSKAAQEIADEYFDSDKVLGNLLEKIMNG
ncbi:MAG: hypothetical protein JW715_13240 [Sedimentisphaerales bacterium]|nr:hypothetical protein [Sedimentisphaerales bacterium]